MSPKQIQITSTSPRDGTIVKKGGNVKLSCKTSHQWFFCVWKGPGEIKQVLEIKDWLSKYDLFSPNFYNLIMNLHQLKFLSYTNLVCHSRKLSWNCVRDRPKNKTDRGTWLLRHRNNSRYPEWLWNLGLSCQRNRRSQ